MITKERILKAQPGHEYFHPSGIVYVKKEMALNAMETYAMLYHQAHSIKLTDDHCICTGDQYGWTINPKCLLHGNKFIKTIKNLTNK